MSRAALIFRVLFFFFFLIRFSRTKLLLVSCRKRKKRIEQYYILFYIHCTTSHPRVKRKRWLHTHAANTVAHQFWANDVVDYRCYPVVTWSLSSNRTLLNTFCEKLLLEHDRWTVPRANEWRLKTLFDFFSVFILFQWNSICLFWKIYAWDDEQGEKLNKKTNANQVIFTIIFLLK